MPDIRARRLVPRMLGGLLLTISAARLVAQCPDGTPPPCNGGSKTVVPRTVVQLNPRSWIVVPFTNATRAPELDWLRDGSVNLLSLDLGRWNDITVIPDQRVGDLLRELPAGKTRAALTLNDGLSIARRAGAGMLVMGDFYRAGKATRLVANVFDVRNGSRIRSVTQQAPDQDSLLTAFAPLARGVLAVPAPNDAHIGDVGTKRLDAYQEYLIGVKALNRFDLAEARPHLVKALALDSTFALAHLEYARFLAWGDRTPDGDSTTRHALAAQRLGTSLPKRERMLIDASVALYANDYGRTCDISRSLVAQDSTDVQALYLLGECSYHDNKIIPSAADSMTGMFRGSWNTSLHSFQKILELDPTFLGAFEHVLDISIASQRGASVCPSGVTDMAKCVAWHSVTLRRGDTLENVPVRESNAVPWHAQLAEARRDRPRLANIAFGETIARRWLAADPQSGEAHYALARLALARGDLTTAHSELAYVPPRAEPDALELLRAHLEVAAKSGHGAEARAILDSLIKTVPDRPAIDVDRGSLELMFGRMTRLRRGLVAAGRRAGPEGAAYEADLPMALLGFPGDSMAAHEAAFYAALVKTGCAADCVQRRLGVTLFFALHKPVGALATPAALSSEHTNMEIVRAYAANDTTRLRAAATQLETLARENVATGTYDPGYTTIAVQGYLALHDSVAALTATRFFVDTAMALSPLIIRIIPNVPMLTLTGTWPRMMLLRADLAAAAGKKDEARLWYGRVLDLWADADLELQPVVSRIRSSVASLAQASR